MQALPLLQSGDTIGRVAILTLLQTFLWCSNKAEVIQGKVWCWVVAYSTLSNKPWITTGIKTSCQHKREFYLISRDSNNPKLKAYYKSCCLILSKVIKAAK
jgi:hypothetical protein